MITIIFILSVLAASVTSCKKEQPVEKPADVITIAPAPMPHTPIDNSNPDTK
jgi:hypothetical protein